MDLLKQKNLASGTFDIILGIGSSEIKCDNESYYDQALTMSDNGLGSFERCLHVLVACEGDKKEAEKLLSKVMLKEER